MYGYDFGVRSVPPCIDCWDGHCTMNCGPTLAESKQEIKNGVKSKFASFTAEQRVAAQVRGKDRI